MIDFTEVPRPALGGRAFFIEVGSEGAPPLRLHFEYGGEPLMAAMGPAIQGQPDHVPLSLLIAVVGSRCLNLVDVPPPPKRMEPEALRDWALDVAPQIGGVITPEVVNAYLAARPRPRMAPTE